MSFVPKFELYDYTGTGTPYTFPIVFNANYPHVSKDMIEHKAQRAKGSIIIDGGTESWDLILQGVFIATSYTGLITLVDAMETAVVIGTRYVLKIGKSAGVYYSYNVKRIKEIEYTESGRTNFIEYKITLRCNAW